MKDQLKIPSDLDDDEDGYGDEDDGHMDDENEEFGAFKDAEAEEDHENEVFALARENNEMKDNFLNDNKSAKKESFANSEYVDRIEKIEKQMISDKPWQLQGEVQARERPLNSLLEVHVDFNTASKLPPTITKEKTDNIEAMIK